MNWNVGRKIAAGFGIALLIFTIVGFVSYTNTTNLVAAGESRRQSYEVLSSVDEVFSVAKDIEIGSRSFAMLGEESFLSPYTAALPRVEPALRDLRRLVGTPRHAQRVDALERLIRQRVEVAGEVVEMRRTKPAEAIVMVRGGRGKALMDDIRRQVEQINADETAVLTQRARAAQEQARETQTVIVGGTLSALAIAILVGFLITRDTAQGLQRLTAAAERITRGDLNVQLVDDHRSDEVGELARAFLQMTHALQIMATAAEQIAHGDLRTPVTPLSPDDVLGNAFARMSTDLRAQIQALLEGATVLSGSSSEIVASTSQLAATASQSAAAVSETTTTVEEVRQTAQVSSEKARLVSEVAQKAAQISQDGRKSSQDAIDGMERIRQQMDAIAASMIQLSDRTQAIGQIITSVEDLSVQSNLLAVNAAIEAAKAGDQGRGFAVVAQEVRSLAEQSRQATSQVRTILGEIQKATGAAVMVAEEGAKVVEAGTRHSQVAGASIHTLAGNVHEAAQAATQIAVSSQQQLVGVDQVGGAMESIRQASIQNMTSARQLEGAARNLNDLGQRLKQMVVRYQL